MKPAEIKPENVKTWDVFVQHTKFRIYKPLTWFSAIIRKVTKSYYNHTSEALWLKWELYMIESLAPWITLRKWKDRVDEPYERDIMHLRYSKKFYDSEQDYCISCLMELDKKYDWLGVFKLGIYQIFGWWNQGKITSESYRWCSEYTAYNKSLEGRQFIKPSDFVEHKDFIIIWK